MPLLSGFLPIPLAMMIPFMGAQSLIIGKQFGEGFQYGKRKISAMTNDEFNKLTPQKIAHDSARELSEMIPEMKASITDMREFQSFIVNELIATAKQLPQDIFGEGTEGRGFVEDQFGLRSGLGISEKGFLEDARQFYLNQIKDEPGHAEAFVGGSGRNFSYLRNVSLGSLQTQLIRRKGTDIELEQAIFKEIQRRIRADPNILNPPRVIPKDPEQAIKESGLSGIAKQVADLFTRMKIRLEQYSKEDRMVKRRLLQTLFLKAAKAYNILVLTNRQFGRKYRIDTAKSLAQGRIVVG